MAAPLDRGAAPATAPSRHVAPERYAAWLVERRELDADPPLTSKPLKFDRKVTAALA